jgi:hypothetical protein
MGPFSRQEAGWLNPVEIKENGGYVLGTSELSSLVYKISYGFPSGEYLLIENRFALKWDQDWPATAKGIVIWHIDENAPNQSNRGYPGHPDWPTSHYRFSILQADGNYDIEKGTNLGDAGDFWKKGMVLGESLLL